MSAEQQPWPEAVRDEDELEELLSRPSAADVAFAGTLDGDVVVLGAGGKMGPSLARRVRRALDAAGVVAPGARRRPLLRARSRRVARAPTGSRRSPATCSTPRRSPGCRGSANVLFLAGRKFGSSDRPDLTWAQNVVVPSIVAPHFAREPHRGLLERQRLPARAARSAAARPRRTRPGPSASTRRPASAASGSSSTPRASAARRASSSASSTPSTCATARSSTSPGRCTRASRSTCRVSHVNAIWQGDASSYAFRALALCEAPPRPLVVTGPEMVSVRAGGGSLRRALRPAAALHRRAGRPALLGDASPLRVAPRAARGAARAAPRLGRGLGGAGRPVAWASPRTSRRPMAASDRAGAAARRAARGARHPRPPARPRRRAPARRAAAGRAHPLLLRRRRGRDRGGRPHHPVRDPRRRASSSRCCASPPTRRPRPSADAAERLVKIAGAIGADAAGRGGGRARAAPGLRRGPAEPRRAARREPRRAARALPARGRGAAARRLLPAAGGRAAGCSTRASGGASSRSRRWSRSRSRRSTATRPSTCVRALAASGRAGEVALYTGNDDAIVADLLADFRPTRARARRASSAACSASGPSGRGGRWSCSRR